MKIFSLKRKTIPKIAVIAAGLAVAMMAATVSSTPATATPRASNCTGCHASANGATTTVTAAPSTATPAPGASYTVAITMTANPNGGMTGYGIVPLVAGTGSTFGGNTGTELAFTATMVAPAAAGTYSYTVWTNQGITDGTGQVGSKVYSITVAPVVTTPPTTVPPTDPPKTVPPTTVPPTTVPPTTVPPTTVPPTTVPPITVPPTTVPPTTVPPTTLPPVSGANISSLSPNHGTIGALMTIRGTGLASPGLVKFGTVTASASSWTDSSIVVKVPWSFAYSVRTTTEETLPLWYVSPQQVPVTVTPKDGAASNAMTFLVDSRDGDGERDGDGDSEEGHGLIPSSLVGQSHLGMYAKYGATDCTACHSGLTAADQPSPPRLSFEGVDMKQGQACAACHDGKREFAIFIAKMQPAAATPPTPAGTQIAYGRCSECHAVPSGGESDD